MSEEVKLNVEDRIRKLLNLADKNKNTSSQEAESALLKAQELMAKHGISVDMSAPEKIAYASEMCSHKDNLGFRKPLAIVIGKNFRCKLFFRGQVVTFMGHASDAVIAKEAFEYAYQFAYREGWKLYNKRYAEGEPTRGVFNSYAQGFIAGLQKKLDTQSTALMIVVPPDVQSKFEEMTKGWKVNKTSMRRVENFDKAAYNDGLRDGSTILNGKRLSKS